MLCSKCKTGNALRSHRHGVVEHFASVFSYYPYHCRDCKHRFLQRRSETVEEPSTANRSTEREIRATRHAKDWRRKQRDLVVYGLALLLFLAFLYFITRVRNTPEAGKASPASPSPQLWLAQSFREDVAAGVALRAHNCESDVITGLSPAS